MAANIFFDEEPENRDDLPQENQPENHKSETPDQQATPAFDISDDDELAEMRKAMLNLDDNILDSDNFNQIFTAEDNDETNTNAADQQQPAEYDVSFLNSVRPGMDFEPNSGDQSSYQNQPFSPFSDEDDFDMPDGSGLSTNEPNNDFKQEASDTEQSSSRIDPANIHRSDEEDDISQRIQALRSESHKTDPMPDSPLPAFVIEREFDRNNRGDKLTDKIRRGLVPSETLFLLITGSMSEAEVVSTVRELGIDWKLVPGGIRNDKTQFLVDYFKANAKDTGLTSVSDTVESQYPTSRDVIEEDWRESDSRLQALQESLNLPETPIVKTRSSFFTHLNEEFLQSNTLAKGVIFSLSALAIVLTVLIAYYLINLRNPAVAPAPTVATPTLVTSQLPPYPKSVQLPGGWSFDLQIGSVEKGSWVPTTAEWLQGTEICRLVSLPWNKQLDAVAQTFTPGDIISMKMSNTDQLNFKIESVKTLTLGELNKLVNGDSPCLIVVLTKKETENRQVIISSPDFSSLTNTATPPVTASPSPN